MIWPIYPYRGVAEELDRHADAANRPETRGAPGVYALAVDVWRDGEHLWRSYGLDQSESVFGWADRTLPPDVAHNHDQGRWAVPGVPNIHLWPIPTQAALTRCGAMESLRDIVATCYAVAQLPDAPRDIDKIPRAGNLYMRMTRAAKDGHDTISVAVQEPISRVSVRALVGRVEPRPVTQGPDLEPVRYRASLERRDTRSGVEGIKLPAGQCDIAAPPTPNRVIRAAKEALGVTGWPAQRQGNTLTWHLVKAPYRVVIEPA